MAIGTIAVLVTGLSHLFSDMLSVPDISTRIEPLCPFYSGPIAFIDVLARQATDLINHQQSKKALHRNRELVAGQKRVLEKLVRGASLDDVLTTLIDVIEGYTEGMYGSILLVQSDEERFGTVIGPNLPPSYVETLEGAPISPPYVGPCGKAVDVGEPVICENVGTDTCGPRSGRSGAVARPT